MNADGLGAYNFSVEALRIKNLLFQFFKVKILFNRELIRAQQDIPLCKRRLPI